MAFVPVSSGPTEFPRYAECEAGTTWEGTYTKEGISKFDKPTYTLETGGGEVVLNGAGNLNHQMAKVEKGKLIQVVYSGMDTIKTGDYAGTKAHQFQVFVDDGAGSEEKPF